VGIFWAAEQNSYGLPEMVENIDIYNNLIIRTGSAFGWFDDSSNVSPNDSYKNIRIYHNTVFNTRGIQAFYLQPNFDSNRINPTGCKFINNIICKAKYPSNNPVYQNYFTSSTDFLASSNIWEIRNNCFINGNIPAGITAGNLSGAPAFLDSTSAASPSNYKVLSNSICAGAGFYSSSYPKDYFGSTRINPPTIGFYERVSQDKNLNLNSIIQGFYNSSTNTSIPDTIRVYIRNINSPYSIIDSSKGVLSNTGSAVFSFLNVINGVNYYLVFKHRNALETWSRLGQSFSNGYLYFNFSTTANQAYGNNLIQVDNSPVKFAHYSGDINHDGIIDIVDVISIFNDVSTFASGYLNTDIDGDNVTDLTDLIVTYNNASNFVGVMRP
ncbi:MAG: hypothetical protein ABI528_07695, partial [bacterium]